MGALVLGSSPAKFLIPDSRGNEALKVIQDPHGIEPTHAGKVDESTIQSRWRSSPELKTDGNEWRCHNLLLLHLFTLCAYAVVEFFHYTDERYIFVPEGRVIALLLDQQCGDVGLRGKRQRCRQPLRAG